MKLKHRSHQIVLEHRFDLHQKIHLSFYAAFCMLVILELRNIPVDVASGSFFLFFLGFFFFFLLLIFSKKGFLAKDKKLYHAFFIQGLPLYKRRIDLKGRPVISILKFKKKQKYAFFSAASPDLSHGFGGFDLYLLNERHTNKQRLLSLKKKGMAENAVHFLTTHTSLKQETYSPRFF